MTNKIKSVRYVKNKECLKGLETLNPTVCPIKDCKNKLLSFTIKDKIILTKCKKHTCEIENCLNNIWKINNEIQSELPIKSYKRKVQKMRV